MRSMCGCPENRMPNLSQTSRSYQLTDGQRPVIVVYSERPSSASGVFTRRYSLRSKEYR
jgi:hypothetical protein